MVADYVQASANCQTAGRAIAHMFNELRKIGFRASNFECSGHSLGAHVCSYAAKYTMSEFGFKISRMTGMDPAGPLFEKTDIEVRFDRTDAEFVDVIHANAGNENDGFMGIHTAVGHADFFPNGGHHVGYKEGPKQIIDHGAPSSDAVNGIILLHFRPDLLF